MIAADTSAYRRFLAGERGADVEKVDAALEANSLQFPPVVATELLSDPYLSEAAIGMITEVPLLDVLAGFWHRAGRLRSLLLRNGLKAAIADVLIAQCCIDHDVPLITRDRDFRHFLKAGLKLL